MNWAKVEKRNQRFAGDYQFYVKCGATKKQKNGSTIGPFMTEAEAKTAAAKYRQSQPTAEGCRVQPQVVSYEVL